MSREVNEIVRFASSDEGKKLMSNVLDHNLPPVLDDLAREYLNFDGARNLFMWKWVHELAPQNTLPCVKLDYINDVPTDKTITILFITLLDDILEKQRDRATFEEASKIPFPERQVQWERDDIDTEYIEFVEKVWTTLVTRIKRGPQYNRYEELFRYDIKQAINAIDYTNLAINRPDLATLHDLELYESHNMVMFAYADIDLMHSAPGVAEELSTIREAVWHAQHMARIGNWVSTWERELKEGDSSSGVIVYALRKGIISEHEINEIHTSRNNTYQQLVDRIHDEGIEELFLDRWDTHYHDLLRYNDQLDTMDLTPFANGLKEVLRYHLASKGLK